MSTSSEEAFRLARRLELAGFVLSVVRDNLLVVPGSKLSASDKELLTNHRLQVIRVVRSRCLSCRRLRDQKGCCWKCFSRNCESCGRDTGSCFIANCLLCQAGVLAEGNRVAG